MNNMKLRVCLTEQCNFKCSYCHPGGEGYSSKCEILSDKQLVSILHELSLLGIESFRLTGGEPMLRKNFFQLVTDIRKIANIKKVTMVTNGSIINGKNINKLKELGLKSLTVSLDTLSKEQFAEMVGVDCLEKVHNNILLLKDNGVKVKINTVVTKNNEDQIYPLIIFAIKNELDIKLLDLFERDKDYWKSEYIALDKVCKSLSTLSNKSYVQKQDEGFGIPEEVYEICNSKIVVKNSNNGSCFCDYCYECEKYPCQTGIVSFVLTHDGFLKLCTLNSNKTVDAKRLLDLEQKEEASEEIKLLFKIYNNSKFEIF